MIISQLEAFAADYFEITFYLTFILVIVYFLTNNEKTKT